jgi:hypothetical protein
LAHRHPRAEQMVRRVGLPPWRETLLAVSWPDEAPRRGTTTSWGRVPTMFTATLRLRMATAHQATDPLAFDKGELPHRHPRAERMVRLAATPPRRHASLGLSARRSSSQKMTMSRGAGPNNSTATSWNPTDERSAKGRNAPSTNAIGMLARWPTDTGRQKTTLVARTRVRPTPTPPRETIDPRLLSRQWSGVGLANCVGWEGGQFNC